MSRIIHDIEVGVRIYNKFILSLEDPPDSDNPASHLPAVARAAARIAGLVRNDFRRGITARDKTPSEPLLLPFEAQHVTLDWIFVLVSLEPDYIAQRSGLTAAEMWNFKQWAASEHFKTMARLITTSKSGAFTPRLRGMLTSLLSIAITMVEIYALSAQKAMKVLKSKLNHRGSELNPGVTTNVYLNQIRSCNELIESAKRCLQQLGNFCQYFIHLIRKLSLQGGEWSEETTTFELLDLID